MVTSALLLRGQIDSGAGAVERGMVVARVLVVDDEPDVRFLLRRCFDQAGHEVREAGDGATALRLVRESSPDLVVTDLMMPVMSGFELIRRLRADPATAKTLIVVVSSKWESAAGMDAALAKPFVVGDLLAVAENLIEKGRDAG